MAARGENSLSGLGGLRVAFSNSAKTMENFDTWAWLQVLWDTTLPFPSSKLTNRHTLSSVVHCNVDLVPEYNILQGWTIFKLLVQKLGRLTEGMVYLIHKLIKIA